MNHGNDFKENFLRIKIGGFESSDEILDYRSQGQNRIKSTKYSKWSFVPKNLFEVILNMFVIFVELSMDLTD